MFRVCLQCGFKWGIGVGNRTSDTPSQYESLTTHDAGSVQRHKAYQNAVIHVESSVQTVPGNGHDYCTCISLSSSANERSAASCTWFPTYNREHRLIICYETWETIGWFLASLNSSAMSTCMASIT